MAISSPDLKAFLIATPFFGGLSDASLDLLVSMLVERRFDVGATVVAEGEPGRSMFIVHSGELVVSKLTDSGRAIRMASLEPGDFEILAGRDGSIIRHLLRDSLGTIEQSKTGAGECAGDDGTAVHVVHDVFNSLL